MGDGGPATSAKLSGPWGTAWDAAGNLYIADSYNHRVRKVAHDGTITTIAGNGTATYSGDGSQATSAGLKSPIEVTVDVSGTLYIVDGQDNRIRKVTPAGIISTVAGNGSEGFAGDGGPATQAKLAYPHGLAVDPSGNLYIGDSRNGRIRKVTQAGIITTFAGNGATTNSGDGGSALAAGIAYPTKLIFDPSGSLYFPADARIRRIAPNGIITTVAGNGDRDTYGDGGPATSAALKNPSSIIFDGSRNLYIADEYRLRKVWALP
jgi:sugar lactone lactonase YvrE